MIGIDGRGLNVCPSWGWKWQMGRSGSLPGKGIGDGGGNGFAGHTRNCSRSGAGSFLRDADKRNSRAEKTDPRKINTWEGGCWRLSK